MAKDKDKDKDAAAAVIDAGTATPPAEFKGQKLATLKAPPGVTSFSFEGEELTIAEGGTVKVPYAVAAELAKHGFTGLD